MKTCARKDRIFLTPSTFPVLEMYQTCTNSITLTLQSLPGILFPHIFIEITKGIALILINIKNFLPQISNFGSAIDSVFHVEFISD